MLDKLGGDFLNRMKNMFGGEKKDQSTEMTVTAEGELAVEKFKLMAAAGSEGQAPVVTYREGNTIILSDLPMGTVLREKYSSDEAPGINRYIFFYVGG